VPDRDLRPLCAFLANWTVLSMPFSDGMGRAVPAESSRVTSRTEMT
jgi:hypothetical protein